MRRHDHLPDWLQPTPEMQDITRTCSNMQTTFWLNEKQTHDLMMCGQVTTCFKLVKNLHNRLEHAPEIRELFMKVVRDWKELKKNPRFILDQLEDPDRMAPKLAKSTA